MSTTSEPAVDEAELLRRARSGDDTALETLYTTYVDSARGLARRLVGADAADDLVAEAFARVLAQIRAGGGPTQNFRAYLCTTIRNRHTDIAPVLTHEQPASDRPWLLDGTETPLDDALDSFDDDEAVAALSQLPHTWRQVLWHLEIEGRRVPEVADLLHTTPAAISSLAYRAREGLKTAYLDQHLAHTGAGAGSSGAAGSGSCGWVRERLAPFVRGGLGARAAGKVDTHLTDCAPCSGLLTGLERVNNRLAALVVPILLVGATKGVKIGVALGGATATSGGIATLFHGPRPKPTTTAATTVGVGAVAAAAVLAVAAIGPPDDPAPDDAAPPATSSPAGGNAPATPDADDPRPTTAPAPRATAPPTGAAAPRVTDDEPAPADAPAPPPDDGDAPAPPSDTPPPDAGAPPDAPPPTATPPPPEPDNTGPGKTQVDNHGQQVAAEKAAPPALDKKPKQPKGNKPKGKPAQPGPPDHANGGRKKK